MKIAYKVKNPSLTEESNQQIKSFIGMGREVESVNAAFLEKTKF
ncbi:hypothetical protein [Virgibacillus salexigens]|nr:hypothetical protein [Virgibacillus salexigens]